MCFLKIKDRQEMHRIVKPMKQFKSLILVIFMALSLNGCGIEVAGVAAANASSNASQALQGQEDVKALKGKIEAAMIAESDRLKLATD